MTKYNVTYTVYFESDIKNIDTAIMADNEDEAIKFSKKKLEKYLEKRAKQMDTGINEVELDSVKVYDSRTDGDTKVNSFSEYKKA